MPSQTENLTAALSDRYRIERELGQGGMATVYLARDLKHDRDVAIKVLHPDLARSLTGDRFLREIGITARLNHPHILALLDSGVAGDGEFLYYVMPVATGESLRDRLDRGGAMPVAEALRVAVDATEALVHAHAHGIVHRDIKPANVLLSAGHAIVVDFGIAKAVGSARGTDTLTSVGTSLGTPTYMAPEQAAGDETDHRADVYAVGALLFEMVAGVPAFTGTWQQVVAAKMAKDAPSLAERSPSAPAELVRLVARCLARDPAGRPATAESLLGDLRALSAPEPQVERGRSRTAMIAGGLALVAVGLLAIVLVRDRRARWVHQTALPTIQRLIDADQLDSAFNLAEEVARRAPDDSALASLWFNLAQTQTFLSEPPGAIVTRAALSDTSEWIHVGTTPTPPTRIPKDAWFYRYALPGYRSVTVIGARLGGSYVPIPSPVPMQRITDPDSDMVLLRGGRVAGTLFGLGTDTFDLADFLMDRLEITNRQYKAFIEAGGYTNRTWWDSTIAKDGRAITWDAAMALFVDKTGRPGPSTWEGGAPPGGMDDHPLGGVSWYEARAYSRYAGKSLPTLFEWNAAAIPEAARWVVPNGRYESSSPVVGGAARGVSPRGVYDMAGNVREWTLNAREPGSRYILGGGWSDPPYLFSEIYAQPEFDRSPINGIRLVRRVGEGKDLARASAPISPLTRDINTLRPVDDATFRSYRALYDVDPTPLNAQVVARDTTHNDWVREDIEFDVPGTARMQAVLFLPKRVQPPFQTLVVWPASDAFILRDRANLSMSYVDFFVRSGRAVVYPIYEHTYGRGTTAVQGDVVTPTIEHRDQMVRWTREMRRSIDYALTRPDVDSTRLGFIGTSWGARIAGVVLAIEPRFRTAVLNVAGIGAPPRRPEEDAVNFLPRISIPVLVLSGRFDSVFPLETSQKPFMRLLGTPAEHKKQILFDGGHFLPRTEMMAESLKWLDEYLGPVRRQ